MLFHKPPAGRDGGDGARRKACAAAEPLPTFRFPFYENQTTSLHSAWAQFRVLRIPAPGVPRGTMTTLSMNPGNIQQAASNAQHPAIVHRAAIGCSLLDVGCWMISFGSGIQRAKPPFRGILSPTPRRLGYSPHSQPRQGVREKLVQNRDSGGRRVAGLCWRAAPGSVAALFSAQGSSSAIARRKSSS